MFVWLMAYFVKQEISLHFFWKFVYTYDWENVFEIELLHWKNSYLILNIDWSCFRTVLATVNNSSMESDQSEIANFHTNDFKECDEEKRDKNEKPFQSAKEQECWSSFRKMTNKGFSVSFDTILRFVTLYLIK